MNLFTAGAAQVKPTAVIASKPVTVTTPSGGTRMWAGEGPPSGSTLIGVQVGETYLDTTSGNLYRLDPGE